MKSSGSLAIAIKLAADLALCAASFALAMVLVVPNPKVPILSTKFIPLLLGIILVRGASFIVFGIPRQRWTVFTLRDVERLANTVIFGSLLFYSTYFAASKDIFSLKLAVVDTLIAVSVLSLLRHTAYSIGRRAAQKRAATPTLIVGAGEAGEMVWEELWKHPELGLKVVGFVDDDPEKLGQRVKGIPVLGDRYAIPEIIEREGIGHVIIAIPSTSGDRIRGIVDKCREFDVQVQIVPALKEIIDGTVRLEQIRPIRVEDLLHRDPVQIDLSSVKKSFYCKRVLITGAGGSIGSELARQISTYNPEKLLLLDIDETAIFNINRELASKHHGCTVSPIVEDICNAAAIKALFSRQRPDIVFHAAAHKHAPLMELNFRRVLRNNIFGTLNLLREAKRVGVESFVLISSDKAVQPVNFMGASKKVCEILTRRFGKTTGSRFVTVRFGNVLGSQGSVVPIFEEQIKNGGPVTITHPEAERYFMTIYEAVQLITQATVLAKNGEVLVLDMGKPVKIKQLAEDLIRLCTSPRHRKIEIKYVGLREGEKVKEALWSADEEVQPTPHPKINVALSKMPANVDLDSAIDRLWWAITWGTKEEVVEIIREIVPEFKPLEYEHEQLEDVAFALSYDIEEAPPAQTLAKVGYVEPD